MSYANDDAALISACQQGHLKLVQFLIENKEIPENANPIAFNCRPLLMACTNNHIELAQYLYTLPQIHDYYDIVKILQNILNEVYHGTNSNNSIINSNNRNMDMFKFVIGLEPLKNIMTQEYINTLLKDAFHNEYLDVAQYLVKNDDLPFTAQNSDFAFIYAYQSGNLDSIKYLLSCKDLHPATDIHIQQEGAFRTALLQQRLDIIEYYIFDCALQYNTEIGIHLKLAAKKDPDFVKVVRNLFDLQQLNHDLHSDLPLHNSGSRRVKI